MSSTAFRTTNQTLAVQDKRIRGLLADSNITNLPRGSAVALITGTARNQKQTIAFSGSPTSGKVNMTFEGTPFVINWDDTAAEVEATLAALVGVGNVDVTGGPVDAGGSLVIEFIGQLAARTQDLIVVGSSTFDAGVATVSITQTAIQHDRIVAWAPTLVSPPPALTLAGNGSGADWLAGDHKVFATWGDQYGNETLAGPVKNVTLTSNQNIRISAINAAGTPDTATTLNVYVDGQLAKKVAVSTPGTGGNVVQTDLAGYDTSIPRSSAPTVGTHFAAQHGAGFCIGVLDKTISTDAWGNVFFAQTPGATIASLGSPTADVVIGCADLKLSDVPNIAGFEALFLSQLDARIVTGSVAGGDAVVALNPTR